MEIRCKFSRPVGWMSMWPTLTNFPDYSHFLTLSTSKLLFSFLVSNLVITFRSILKFHKVLTSCMVLAGRIRCSHREVNGFHGRKIRWRRYPSFVDRDLSNSRYNSIYTTEKNLQRRNKYNDFNWIWYVFFV